MSTEITQFVESKAGIDALSIYIENTGTAAFDIDWMYLAVEQAGVTVYRWLDVAAKDANGVAIPGTNVTIVPNPDGADPALYDATIALCSESANADAIAYLSTIIQNYTFDATAASGRLVVPVLSDIISDPLDPNADFVGNYLVTIHFMNGTTFIEDIVRQVGLSSYPWVLESNNTQMLEVSTTDPTFRITSPELWPEALFDGKAVNGEPKSLDIAVHNDGDKDATTVLVQAWDGDPRAGFATFIDEDVVPFVPLGGGVTNVTLTWLNPSPVGDHYVFIFVDENYLTPLSSNAIAETDEENNWVSKLVTVYERPNLNMTIPGAIVYTVNGTMTNTIAVGSTVTIGATVWNDGGTAATSLVSFFVGDSSPDGNGDGVVDSPLSGGITPLGNTTITVGAGTYATTSVSWLTPAIGSYKIWVFADPLDSINEVDEMDNLAAGEMLNVVQRTDFIVSVNCPATAISSVNVPIFATVTNNGGAAFAGTIPVVFRLDGIGGTVIAWANITVTVDSPLASGDSRQSATVQWMTTPGAHSIFAIVDPANLILEADDGNNVGSSPIAVTERAELYVSSLYVFNLGTGLLDMTPMAGDIVNLGSTVQNTGGTDVSNVQVSVYHGTAVPANLVTTYTIATLPAYSQDYTEVVWDTTGLAGIRQMTYVVDKNNAIPELDETNNQYTQMLVIYSQPYDLIVNDSNTPVSITDYSDPAYIHQGFILVEESGVLNVTRSVLNVLQPSANKYNIVVRDNGTLLLDLSDVTSPYDLKIHLYNDATLIIRGDGYTDVANIAAGIVASERSKVYIFDASVKSFSLDIAPSVELYAYNTTFTSSILSLRGVGTVAYLTNCYVPSVTVSDANAVAYIQRFVRAQVRDMAGKAVEGATVRVYVPLFLGGAEVAGSPGTTDAAGDHIFKLMSDIITSTGSQYVGNYRMQATYVDAYAVTHTSAFNTIALSQYPSTANQNPAQFPTVLLTLGDVAPDFVVSNVAVTPAMVKKGSPVLVSFDIENAGSNDATNVVVSLIVGTSSVASMTIPSLDQTETLSLNFTYTPATIGTKTLTVYADYSHSVTELNETNNDDSTTLNVISLAELSVVPADISVTGTLTEGQTVTVSAVVRNTGDKASGAFDVAFYYDLQDEAHRIGSNKTVATINALASATVQTSWIVPQGFHQVIVVADCTNVVWEYDNTTNNVAVLNLTILGYPDLTPQPPTFDDSTPADGQLVVITAVVQNTGESDSDYAGKKVLVEFWDGAPAVAGSILIEAIEVANIPANSSVPVTAEWTASVGAALLEETHDIYVRVDPYAAIVETDETDNQAMSSVTVMLRSDLTLDATDITFNPDTPKLGDSVVISAVVHNLGGTNETGVSVDFYDGDPSLGGSLIGTFSIASLLRSSTAVATTTWATPAAGAHTVFVWVDRTDVKDEFDEGNNIASTLLTVYSSYDLVVNDANTPRNIIGTPAVPAVFVHNAFTLVEESGTLYLENARFEVVQAEDDEYNIIVKDSGTLRAVDSTITSSLHLNLYLYDGATLDLEGCTVAASISIIAQDGAAILLDGCTISGDLDVANTLSAVTLTAFDTAFTKALDPFAGTSVATLTNCSTPSVKPTSSSIAYINRWIFVSVIDGNGWPVVGADVDLTYYFDDDANFYWLNQTVTTGIDGTAVFDARGDNITTAGRTFVGRYGVQATWGAYTSLRTAVTLDPYTEPLQKKFKKVTLELPGILPDLTLSDLTLSPAATPKNTPVTVSVNVTNTGEATVPTAIVTFMANGVTFATVPVANLGPMATTPATAIFTPTYVGLINITAWVDKADVIIEAVDTFTDNAETQTLDVLSLADLSVTASGISFSPTAPTENATVMISATVRNLGDAATPGYVVRFYVDGLTTVIGSVNKGLLNPGETTTAQLNWAMAGQGVLPGIHRIYVVADADNTTAEYEDWANNMAYKDLSVNRYANLVVTDPVFSNVNPDDADTVTISVIVSNEGQTAAGSFSVQLLLDTYSGGTEIGKQTVTGLAPTESKPLTFTWTATLGTGMLWQVRTIYAVADSAPNAGVIPEGIYENETNIGEADINVTRRANLYVTSADITFMNPTPFLGDNVPIQVTIHNSGGRDAPVAGNFQLSFHLGTAATTANKFNELPASVPANSAATFTLLTWVPGQSGEQTVAVYADWNADIKEPSKADNTASKILVIYGPYDIIVNNTLSQTIDSDYTHTGYVLAYEGGVLTLANSTFTLFQASNNQRNILLKEQGVLILDHAKLTTNYALKIYLYDQASLVIRNGSEVSTSISILAAEDSTVVVTESIVRGSIATFGDAPAVSLFARNSTVTGGVRLEGASSGQVVNCDAAFLDVGSVDNPANFIEHYRFIKAVVLDANGVPIEGAYVEVEYAIAGYGWLTNSSISNADGVVLFKALCDIITPSGNLYYGNYKANASYLAFDSKEKAANVDMYTEPLVRKTTVVTFNLDARPDLVSAITVEPASVQKYENVYVNVTVTNTGPTWAMGVLIRVKVDTTGQVLFTTTQDLAPTVGTYTHSLVWNPASVGTMVISVSADPSDDIIETDDANNDAVGNVTVISRPDFVAQEVWFSASSPTQGATITLYCKVSNIGDSAGTSVRVSFFDGAPSLANLIANATIASLPAGATTGTVSIPNPHVDWAAVAGDHTITAYIDWYNADPDGAVTEYDETNNEASADIHVKTFADLTVDVPTFNPVNPVDGQTVRIDALVSNVGETDATLAEVQFWDGDPQGTGTYINKVYITIPASDSKAATYFWPATTNGLSQDHDIFVLVNPSQTISESNYTNNQANATVTVTLRPDLLVESVTFNNTSPVQGDSVRMDIVVSNIGGIDVTDAEIRIFDYVEGTGLVQVGTPLHVAVPSDSTNATFITWVPSAGAHRLSVYVDYFDTVDEFNETNNVFETLLMVYGPNDLVVDGTRHLTISDITYKQNGFVLVKDQGWLELDGATLEILQSRDNLFSVVVMDQGMLTLTDSKLTSLKLTDLHVYDDATIVIGDGSTLDAKVTTWLYDNATATFDGAAVKGAVHLPSASSTADLVAYDTVFDVAFTKVKGASTLELTNVKVPSITLSDSSVARIYRWLTISVVDGNDNPLNNTIARVYDYSSGVLYRSSPTDIEGVAVIQVLASVLRPASSTFHGNYKVNASYTYAGDDYFSNDVGVAVAEYSAPLTQVNPSVTVKVAEALPSLDPPFTPSSDTVVRGRSIMLNTTIANYGIAWALGFYVDFSDITVGLPAGVSPLISRIGPLNLAPGTSVDLSVVWTATKPIGDHTLTVLVDSTDVIIEGGSGSDDNFNATVVTVTGLPDLYIESGFITFSTATPTQFQRTTAFIEVENIGDVTGYSIPVAVYDTATGAMLNQTTVATLASGAATTITLSFVPTVASENMQLRVVIDGANTVPEIRDDNNEAYAQVYVRSRPDISIAELYTVPGTPVNDNELVRIYVKLRNSGETAAPSVSVDIFDATDLIGPLTFSVNANADSALAYLNWRANCGGQTRDTQIQASADPGDLVDESVETNNLRTITVRILDIRPDLLALGPVTAVSGDDLLENVTVGNKITLQAEITNQGISTAQNASVTFAMVEYEDEANQTGNVTYHAVGRGVFTVGTKFSEVIALGASQTRLATLQWTVAPYSTDIVNLTIAAYADFTEEVNETNEANNAVSDSFGLKLPLFTVRFRNVPDRMVVGDDVTMAVRVTDEFNAPRRVEVTAVLRNEHNEIVWERTATTSTTGEISLSFQAPSPSGTYTMNATVSGTATSSQIPLDIQPTVTEEEGRWWIWLIVAIVVILALLIVGFFVYRYGLGNLVQCNECGQYIPDGASKCPKCGVEFEKDTVKCSECQAWIPKNSTACPECGAAFTSKPVDAEDYEAQMRAQYDDMLAGFREKAKEELGDKATEEEFQKWWVAQPEFITFEDWLSREEAKKKGASFPCPQCGTTNSTEADVCVKCGTDLLKAQTTGEIAPAPMTPLPSATPAAQTPEQPAPAQQQEAPAPQQAPVQRPPTTPPQQQQQAGQTPPPPVMPRKVIVKPAPKKVIARKVVTKDGVETTEEGESQQ